MSRVRDLQKFLEDIHIISHHRDEHGRLIMLVHSLGQGRLVFYEVERELAVSAADGMVQYVASTIVLLQDHPSSASRLQIAAVPEQDISYRNTSACHCSEQRRLAVRVDAFEECGFQSQGDLAEPLVSMHGGDVQTGVTLWCCCKQQARIV